MFKTLQSKLQVITISVLVFLGLSLAVVPAASTSAQDIDGSVNCGSDISLGTGCEKPKAAAGRIENLIKVIINVLSAIVGAVCVIMIIIGGFRYVTSAGDSNAVSGAKNTILYAIVGLIIVAFAQVIVRFVLQRI